MSILSVPIQYSLLHDQHLPPEWYNCYSWWAYIDTFLASKVHNFHQDSLTVVHGIDLDRFIITCVYHHSHARLSLHTFRLSSVHFQFSSVQLLSRVWLLATAWLPRHARFPCPSPTPGVYSNSCPSGQWCNPTVSSSVIPFSSCLHSFPESGSFPVSRFFTSGDQSLEFQL